MSDPTIHRPTAGTTTGEQTRQAAADVTEGVAARARDLTDAGRSEARSVLHDARDQASGVVSSAQSELRVQAAEHTKNLAASLEDLGRQLEEMADATREPDAPVSQLARSAAQTLSERAGRIDAQGLDGLVDDMKRFARNRPGMFVLGSVAAGFAIGRLAKHADLREIADHAKDQLGAGTSGPDTSNPYEPGQRGDGTARDPQDDSDLPAPEPADAVVTSTSLSATPDGAATAGEVIRP